MQLFTAQEFFTVTRAKELGRMGQYEMDHPSEFPRVTGAWLQVGIIGGKAILQHQQQFAGAQTSACLEQF